MSYAIAENFGMLREVENDAIRSDNENKCSACGRLGESFNSTFPIASGRGLKRWKRCASCKAYFLVESYEPVKEVVHTKKTAWGREDTGTELNNFKKKMFLSVLDLIRKNCPPPATLLDVGCSYGGFLSEARKAGYSVRGSDIVPTAVEYVRAQGISADVCFSIGELSVEDNSLDVITCLDSHYYWPDQAAELGHAYTKLRPGGYLAMRVVDKSWMFSIGLKLRKVSNPAGEKLIKAAVNDHRFSMPFPSLLDVIKSAGFDIVYASPRGAIHSNQSKLRVKISFMLGALVWLAGKRKFLAPGALVLATKRRS